MREESTRRRDDPVPGLFMIHTNSLSSIVLSSLGDLLTDIVVIFEYISRGEYAYAWATLASILANHLLQSLIVYFDYKKQTFRKQIWEQVFVWTMVKPGVDAYRVASEKKQDVGAKFSPTMEMAFSKVIETVAESIPGSLIQLAVILRTGSKTSTPAIFSYALCIFTPAFTSAMLSWDFDTAKDKRRREPSVYGYIPDTWIGKVVVLLSLFSLSSSNLMVRSSACVLFYMKGGFSGVATILGAELLLYLLVKGLRRDLWHWSPTYGVGGLVVSLLGRVGTKVMSDWTALVHLHHPVEVGGAYFTFSLLVTVAFGASSALGYEKDPVEEGEGGPHGDRVDLLEESTVVSLMSAACAGVVLSYCLLLLSIKREYLPSFVSKKTANVYIQEKFTKNEDEWRKFHIFFRNRHKWEYAVGDKVKTWLSERLPVWLDEEPEWFDDLHKSRIEDDFISDKALLARVRTNNVKVILQDRRRSSVFGGGEIKV